MSKAKPHIGDVFAKAVRDGKVHGFSIDPKNPAMAYDPMSLDSKPGERMKFTGYGGYDYQQEQAKKLLTVGHIYTVERVDVGDWSSTVEFKEFPGENFNTVMFEAA